MGSTWNRILTLSSHLNGLKASSGTLGSNTTATFRQLTPPKVKMFRQFGDFVLKLNDYVDWYLNFNQAGFPRIEKYLSKIRSTTMGQGSIMRVIKIVLWQIALPKST